MCVGVVWLEGCLRLLWLQPEKLLVETSGKKAFKLKKEVFWAWLAQGSSEAADRYRQARRAAAEKRAFG